MTPYRFTCLAALTCCLVAANAQSIESAERKTPNAEVIRATTAVNVEEQRQAATRFVQEKISIWQERLKLTDWRISFAIVRRNELKARTLGATHWDKNLKTASISVLDPADYDIPFSEILKDMELTVVHELVHLDLAALPRSEASRSNEERAVVRLADALLNLDRSR